MSDEFRDFERCMDHAIVHCLFSKQYYFNVLHREDAASEVYPLFQREQNFAGCMSREEKEKFLIPYVRMLVEFDREEQLAYLYDAFNTKSGTLKARREMNFPVAVFGNNKFYLSNPLDRIKFLMAPKIGIENDFYLNIGVNKPKVLLLGSFNPSVDDYLQQNKKMPESPKNRFNNQKRLSEIEQIILLSDLLEERGFVVDSGKASNRHIKNVFYRLQKLMNETDHIITILTNQGGVAMEYGAICENAQFLRKNHVFIRAGEAISGYATHGCLLLPETKFLIYKNDENLVDMVLRLADQLRDKKSVGK